MSESVLKSGLRAFFITMCKWLGFICGIVLLFVFLDLLSGSSGQELRIETSYKPEILPNAEGVRKELESSAPVILRLDIVGEIGKSDLTADAIQQQLIESREGALKDGRVKAILVFLNTPGGSGLDSDGIYRSLKRYKELYKLPIYGFIDGICASGGMYVSSACDKVFSTNSSMIGNIGVITSPFFNVSKPMETYGIQSVTIHAGTDKDVLDPFRPWKENEVANIQEMIDFFYLNFVNIVASSRPHISKEKLVQDYGAKIFTAPEAFAVGLIDADNSSESQVLNMLAKEIGVEDSTYQVVRLKDKNVLKALFSSQSPIFSGLWKLRLLLPGQPESTLAQPPLVLQ